MDASTVAPPLGLAAGRPAAAETLGLRVTAGRHRGAVTPLDAAEMLVIGSSEDCDVILSDPGVARHHCILTRQGRRYALRVVDAPALVRGRAHAPGETVRLGEGATLVLGDAQLSLGREEAVDGVTEMAAAAASAVAQGAGLLQRYRWRLLGAGVLVVAGAMALTAVQLHAQPADVRSDPVETATRTIAHLGLNEVHPARNAAGQLELRGVVPDAGGAARLRSSLAREHVAAALAVRSGEEVAHDVAEVLRLSGIAAEARYSGDGSVTVRGHLGDQQALRGAVESRAMHEIEGLKRVLAYNEDHPGQVPAGPAPEGKRLVAAVSGQDPYVVTADGSRYYVGAVLPQGGRFDGVEADALLVERDGHVEHLNPPGLHIGG